MIRFSCARNRVEKVGIFGQRQQDAVELSLVPADLFAGELDDGAGNRIAALLPARGLDVGEHGIDLGHVLLDQGLDQCVLARKMIKQAAL